MKKLHDQKKLLTDLELLINKMEAEIELLRNINYRYYLKYGSQVKGETVEVPEHISFSLTGDKVEENTCIVTNYEKIGFKSNYQEIKCEIEKLNQ